MTVGYGNRTIIKGVGKGEIALEKAYGEKKLILSKVLYVPELNENLISVGRLTRVDRRRGSTRLRR